LPHTIKCRKCSNEFLVAGNHDESLFGDLNWFAGCPVCHRANPGWPVSQEVDFGFARLSDIPRDYAKAVPDAGPLAAVSQAFCKNMNRVLAISVTPQLFVGQWEYSRDRLPMGTVIVSGPPDAMATMRKYSEQEFRHHQLDYSTVDSWFRGAHSVASTLAFEGLLASMLTGTWTALETLAGDLWEAAVNVYPDCMFEQPKPGSKTPRKKPQSKLVELWDIRSQGYDLRGKVGTVLKESVNFTNLDEMRKAYRRVFHDKKINALLKNNAIDILQLVRNILVHKAGVVDAEFVRRADGVPDLQGLTPGSVIALNGEFVALKVSSIIACAVSLIGAVNSWIEGRTKSV
jgi:hypothetical protein